MRRAAGAHARARATGWARATLDPILGTGWVLGLIEGPAGPTLVELSRDASLLVLGVRRQVGPCRVPAGSVSRYALSHSSSPVVAVPAGPEAVAAAPVPSAAATVEPSS